MFPLIVAIIVTYFPTRLNYLVSWYVLCEVMPSPLYTIHFNVMDHQRARPYKRSPYGFHTKMQVRKWCRVFKCVIILNNSHPGMFKITNTTRCACIYEGWNFNSGNYLFTSDTK